MFISFSDSFIPYSAWYKLCPWMSLFKLLAQKRCEPRVMQKQASTTSPVLFCCHTNIEFLLKEGDVQLFHCHDSCGISSVCSCRTPSPIASGCRKKPSANPTKVFALRSIRYVFWLHQTRCDGKKRTADAIVYSYFAAVASLLDPTLLALSLNWKLPHQPLNERPPLFAATKLNKRQNNQNKPSIHTVIDSLTPFFVALLELLQHAEQPFRPLLNPYSLSCKAEWKTIA